MGAGVQMTRKGMTEEVSVKTAPKRLGRPMPLMIPIPAVITPAIAHIGLLST